MQTAAQQKKKKKLTKRPSSKSNTSFNSSKSKYSQKRMSISK